MSGCHLNRTCRRTVLLLLVILGLAPGAFLPAQLTWSGDVMVLVKGLDRHLIENRNFRGDDPFNEVRLRLFPRSWITDRIAFFSEILYDNGARLRVNGAYVVMNGLFQRPWMNLKVGLIPNPFGNFGLRSTYFNLNPLIGIPLMWHYMTPMPTTMIPTNAHLTVDRVSSSGYAPIAYDACWDTGVEFFGELSLVEYSLAITDGALSSPGASANDGRQLILKLGLALPKGLRLGGSLAQGPYFQPSAALDTLVKRPLEDFKATVVGFYAQYVLNYLQLYTEFVRSTWAAPRSHLKEGKAFADSGYLEGRYDFRVRWFLATRLDFLKYSLIQNPATGHDQAWGDDVFRLESGVGYRLNREAILKLVYQRYQYKPGRDGDDPNVLALQLHLVF